MSEDQVEYNLNNPSKSKILPMVFAGEPPTLLGSVKL